MDPDPDYDFEELCYQADQRLFNTILHSPFHVCSGTTVATCSPTELWFQKTATH